MEILEHGIYYEENKIINCSCGCKFEYETSDIYSDNSLAYTTCPPQIQTYVLCPECNSRINLSKIYTSRTFENKK